MESGQLPGASAIRKNSVEEGELELGADGEAGYGQAEESGKAFQEGGAA